MLLPTRCIVLSASAGMGGRGHWVGFLIVRGLQRPVGTVELPAELEERLTVEPEPWDGG